MPYKQYLYHLASLGDLHTVHSVKDAELQCTHISGILPTNLISYDTKKCA